MANLPVLSLLAVMAWPAVIFSQQTSSRPAATPTMRQEIRDAEHGILGQTGGVVLAVTDHGVVYDLLGYLFVLQGFPKEKVPGIGGRIGPLRVQGTNARVSCVTTDGDRYEAEAVTYLGPGTPYYPLEPAPSPTPASYVKDDEDLAWSIGTMRNEVDTAPGDADSDDIIEDPDVLKTGSDLNYHVEIKRPESWEGHHCALVGISGDLQMVTFRDNSGHFYRFRWGDLPEGVRAELKLLHSTLTYGRKQKTYDDQARAKAAAEDAKRGIMDNMLGIPLAMTDKGLLINAFNYPFVVEGLSPHRKRDLDFNMTPFMARMLDSPVTCSTGTGAPIQAIALEYVGEQTDADTAAAVDALTALYLSRDFSGTDAVQNLLPVDNLLRRSPDNLRCASFLWKGVERHNAYLMDVTYNGDVLYFWDNTGFFQCKWDALPPKAQKKLRFERDNILQDNLFRGRRVLAAKVRTGTGDPNGKVIGPTPQGVLVNVYGYYFVVKGSSELKSKAPGEYFGQTRTKGANTEVTVKTPDGQEVQAYVLESLGPSPGADPDKLENFLVMAMAIGIFVTFVLIPAAFIIYCVYLYRRSKRPPKPPRAP